MDLTKLLKLSSTCALNGNKIRRFGRKTGENMTLSSAQCGKREEYGIPNFI